MRRDVWFIPESRRPLEAHRRSAEECAPPPLDPAEQGRGAVTGPIRTEVPLPLEVGPKNVSGYLGPDCAGQLDSASQLGAFVGFGDGIPDSGTREATLRAPRAG